MGRQQQDPDRVVIGDLSATPMRARGERDGRRYWRIRRLTGQRETLATGWWTRVEAEAAVERVRQSPTRSPRSASAGGRTVGDLLREWRDAQVKLHAAGDLAQRTLSIYRTSVRHWLGVPLHEVLVTRLTRATVEDQATSWRADGGAARTVDLLIRVLRQAVAWGAERGLCPDVDLAIPARARDDEHVNCGRVPTRAEVQAVLAVIPPGPRRHGAELLALTGARVGEIVALTVADLDLDARVVWLSGRDVERARRGKTRPRAFPLTGRMLTLVRELADGRQPTDRLVDLPRSGTHLLHTSLVRASELAGVERVTPHGIRRLVVSELLEVADARTVADLTGHSVVVLLRHYVRPTRARLVEVVQQAAAKRSKGKVIRLRAGEEPRAQGVPELVNDTDGDGQ